MSSKPADNVEPLWVRPHRDLYAFVVIVAICGLAVAVAALFAARSSEQPNPLPLWAAFTLGGAIFWLPCLLMLWLMRRLCVVADERGLWFRGAIRQSFVAWLDVENYELRPSPQSGTFKSRWIRYGGKWRRLPQVYAPMDALQARIRDEAKWSRAREWQLSIERDEAEQWPKTYAYPDPSGRKSFGFVVAALLLAFVLSVGQNWSGDSARAIRLIWDNLDGWGRIMAVAVPLIFLSMWALLLVPHYMIFRAKQKLGHQIIRADRDALTLLDGGTQTRILWDDVTDYGTEDATGRFRMPQSVVESDGARIVFRPEIENMGELKALIRAKSVNAKSDDWRAREESDSDTLGGESSLWSGGAVGVGRKVYHYRTRTTRAMLGLGGAIVLISGGASLSSHLRRGWELSDIWIALLIFTPIAALTICGVLAFWRASIQTDENGLLQRGIWRERALNWDEIEAFTFNGYFHQIKGASTTMRYGTVAASESLQAEIEARSGVKMRRTDRPNDD